MRRALTVLAAVLGLTVGVLARAPAPIVSAQTAIGSVIVEGTGNGHGRGMSQWGAYGWAVDRGWNWMQILDHYYGNTALADVGTSGTIDVQLRAFDGSASLGVVSYVGNVNWNGNVAASMAATEVAPNQFQVYSAATPACPPPSGVPVGWKVLGPLVPGPIEFTTDNGPINANRMTTGAATAALGVCGSAGKVTHYRGSVRIEDGNRGVNRVVNRVLVEDYLRGVVPKEISASWADAGGGRGLNAVMAQAVAARSYALQPGRWTNGICDTQSCQVYFGAASRASVGLAAIPVEDRRSDNAIALTVGKVRVWTPGGQGVAGSIVSTEYSGSNGPRTAGWPFPVRDDAPGDGTALNRNHRWTRVLDGDVLAARHGLGILTSVSMVEGDPRYDGIWYNDVVLTGTAGSVRIPAWTFRGQNGLPSPGFTLRGEPRGARPMTANQRIELPVVGERVAAPDGTVNVVPAGVSAVALNITAVTPSAAGYATVWPCDVARPDASNLNFVAGGVVANGVIAPVGANGRVCFFTNATTHFLVDIAGWFSGGTTSPAFVGATPQRVVDTRNAIGGLTVRIQPGATLTVPMAGAALRRSDGSPATIPPDATAVAVNVTAVQPSNPGYFTVWPCGAPRPEASNVNFTRGGAVANGVVAPLGAGGAICIYSDQAADVLVDVLGWFGGGTSPAFVGAVPRRLVDTRNAIGGPAAVITPSAVRAVPVRNVTLEVGGLQRQVPADASAVALNITMVEAHAAGFATVWPCGTPQPDASNVNFAAGATVANGVVAPIGPDGSVCVATSANAHLLVDVAGWFTGGAAGFVGNVPRRLVDTRNSIGPLAQ